MRSDKERSLLSVIERVFNNFRGVELVLMTFSQGEHAANGFAEVGFREIKAQTGFSRRSAGGGAWQSDRRRRIQ